MSLFERLFIVAWFGPLVVYTLYAFVVVPFELVHDILKWMVN